MSRVPPDTSPVGRDGRKDRGPTTDENGESIDIVKCERDDF